MRTIFPTMNECPEKPTVFLGLFFGFICFFSVPFILLLLMTGSYDDSSVLTWCEIVYHVFLFAVAVFIFREYLADSFFMVQTISEQFITTVAISVGLMLAVGMAFFLPYYFTGNEHLYLAAMGTIPVTEIELFILSGDIVYFNPLFGTLCLVLLTPVTTSCLLYATSFAPVCTKNRWLGYLTVALVMAFPRYCNGVTHWDPDQQLLLFFTHLPIHFIACWAYQKTDNICAPIAAHMITNLISCCAFLLLFFVL